MDAAEIALKEPPRACPCCTAKDVPEDVDCFCPEWCPEQQEPRKASTEHLPGTCRPGSLCKIEKVGGPRCLYECDKPPPARLEEIRLDWKAEREAEAAAAPAPPAPDLSAGDVAVLRPVLDQLEDARSRLREAAQLWQAAHGKRPDEWPDFRELVGWLLARYDALAADVMRLHAEVTQPPDGLGGMPHIDLPEKRAPGAPAGLVKTRQMLGRLADAYRSVVELVRAECDADEEEDQGADDLLAEVDAALGRTSAPARPPKPDAGDQVDDEEGVAWRRPGAGTP